MLDIAYPKTLPTLKPPNTNATARERSSNGIDLHMVMNLINKKGNIVFGRANIWYLSKLLFSLQFELKNYDLELNININIQT